MSKNDQFEIDGGWIATAVCLAAVWPIGLIMLWNRVKKFKKGKDESRQMSRAGTSLLVAGLGMTFLFGWAAWGIPEAIIGGGLLFLSRKSKKQQKRVGRYLALIGGRPVVSLYDIAAAMPLPVKQVLADLQQMISDGYFGLGAYINHRTMEIVLDGRAPEGVWQEPIYAEPEPQPQPQPEPAEETAEAEPVSDDQYGQWIKAIREVNDRIDDRVISDKIDRIETLTARIFEMIKSRPDKEGQIRKFMNYYLPTTIKLLDSYALLEAQGIEGDNITASKHQIEGIMDTLIQGFEKQLDMLFSAQAMDINSDIEVLENMMAADGLKENEFQLKRAKSGR